MPPSQPPLPLTLPNGEPLPPPPGEDYREHTAERWKETDLPSYDFALWLVRSIGITNQSKITAEVTQHRAERGLPGISRNSVRALFNSSEFKPGEFDEIIRRRSQQSTATAIDKIDEILEAVEKPKDLGAAAMALNTLYNVSQISAGKATRITGTTTDAEKARTFDHYRKLAEAKANALQPPPPPIRDVTPVEVENEAALHRPHEVGSVARAGSSAKRMGQTAATEVPPHSSAERMNKDYPEQTST